MRALCGGLPPEGYGDLHRSLDSTIAASLLKRDNYQVIGLHFRTGYEHPLDASTLCGPVSSARRLAERAAEQIGIPLEVIDCSQAFEKEVVRYFVDTYALGKTPNPCIVCNQRIKFGFILEHAKRLGASALATGHYARIERKAEGQLALLKGSDPVKDQSYFLARLTQEQLNQAIFPLGRHGKERVREIGRAMGLTPFMGGESQELCFVRHSSYRGFLAHRGEFPCRPGAIVNTRGKLLGYHQGLHAYTVGQRRGIGIPGPEAYYVIRLDKKQNQLVIGSASELAASECLVADINWIGMNPPDKALSVKTRIRYRHQESDSLLTPASPHEARISFLRPQCAITPGQAAVFYQGDRVLGGGWIVGNR
jgi:tRNA-specific 2-thiouridylase